MGATGVFRAVDTNCQATTTTHWLVPLDVSMSRRAWFSHLGIVLLMQSKVPGIFISEIYMPHCREFSPRVDPCSNLFA